MRFRGRSRTRAVLNDMVVAVYVAVSVMLLPAGGVAAQDRPFSLRGTVFDASTGHALPEVAIHVDQSLIPVRTDTLGEFLIVEISTGAHTITVAKIGYGPQVYSLAITEHHEDTVEVGTFPLHPVQTITAAVSGSVHDSKTGEPVVGTGVAVNGDLAAFSSDRGFTTGRLKVLPGLNTVEFERIGYEPFTVSLWAVRNHTDLDLAVTLDPLPVQIRTVVVEADQSLSVRGALREFYQRRQWGLGHYFTQQDIEEQRPLFISDMLRMTPGVIVRPGIYGGNRVEVIGVRGIKDRCMSTNLFIDGQFIETGNSEDLDGLVHPDNVAAIEVYPRPTGVPAQYNNRGSVCGVILVWTRR